MRRGRSRRGSTGGHLSPVARERYGGGRGLTVSPRPVPPHRRRIRKQHRRTRPECAPCPRNRGSPGGNGGRHKFVAIVHDRATGGHGNAKQEHTAHLQFGALCKVCVDQA
ncbi:hypothetical protein RAJCM14343_0698 [Rhodococcus aetherivorans]|uniref:Uncharacterized protein n=1 Tax=Rhodococcus aetherivorans TaxID=191292 RepID=A0ABQ0YG29_9NOCA|nr:hypothetical protein RAJCM14343_0698 [Rhodococcus aetherivorans]